MKAHAASSSYHDWLVRSLHDPEEAAAFIEAAIEENDDKYLLRALRIVAEAQGGVAEVASRSKLNRVSLYRMLSDKGNPELSSLLKVFEALGLRLAVLAKPLKVTVKRTRKGPLATKRPIRKLAAARTKTLKAR